MGKAGSVRKSYSTSQTDYQLLEEVGHGASATVYRAIYVPSKEIVAVKRLDFDRCNGNLDDIRKESLTLSMIDHPNVISAYCSFVVEHYLWVVMPFMAEGSCLHLMKIAHPDGFEEPVIGSILKETLKALEYLHKDGHIHRDVKAGNILVDSSGAVKLGDFGVSAWMFDNGDRRRSRNTFVGTPCWMAPEVLQPGGGYNSKADIWSFGITALELAHGHAPFSKYPPMKVLLMTLQNAPPGLDYERDKRFSKSFKEMVAMCLVKDQTKRPTAEKLLKHSFFKRSKPPEFSMRNIFNDLPPLWDRVKTIENKDAEQLALKRMPSSEQEALSQSEYQRGVSAWNFDIEDLKAQASAMHDDEDLPETKEGEESMKGVVPDKDLSSSRSNTGKSVVIDETSSRGNNSTREESELRCLMTKDETAGRILVHSSNHELMDGSENHKLQNDLAPSVSKQDRESSHLKIRLGKKQTYSGPLVSNGAQNNLMMEQGRTSERVEGDNQQAAEKHKRDARKVANFSGPLMLSTRASANSLSAPTRSSGGYGDSMEDKAKPNVVQIKGRFSVTSENVDLVKDIPLCTISQKLSQESPMKKSASVGNWLIHSKPMTSSESLEMNSTIPASVILPHLQNLSRLTSFQQDLIMNLLNSFQQNEIVDGGMISQARTLENDMLVESVTSERERLLLIEISESQARMSTLIDELAAEKLRHIQLQQEFNDLHFGEDMKTEETGDT